MITNYILYVLAIIVFYPLELIKGCYYGISSFINCLIKAHTIYAGRVKRLTKVLLNVQTEKKL
jgi:hypothetical protein